jgi:hypothetical protein
MGISMPHDTSTAWAASKKIARLLCLQVFADKEGSESEVPLNQDPREDPDLEQYVPHIKTHNTGIKN